MLNESRVTSELKAFVPLNFDVTADNESTKKLKKRFGVTELPSLLILDSQGKVVRRIQYIEVHTPEKMLALLKQFPSTKPPVSTAK